MHVSVYTPYPSNKVPCLPHNYDTAFPSRSMSFNNTSNYIKLLSVYALIAFKSINLYTTKNRMS